MDWRSSLKNLEHRGPDGQGYLGFSKDAGSRLRVSLNSLPDNPSGILLHTRLSIIDLTESGAQPMASRDQRYWIAYNGEIYNFVELRAELATLGHIFKTHSDTEVLLAAYCQWGPDAFRRLTGMFAIAILDCQERTLLLARDPFGIKPLYYSSDVNGFTFASELKALYPLLQGRKRINPSRLFQYMRFGMTDDTDDTMISGIRHLPPAHFMFVSLDSGPTGPPVRYWELDAEQRSDLSFDDAAETLRGMFLENVEKHLRSDVQVGACLSGGIDSSAIVSAMRYLKGDALELHTFSYVAEGGLSEERWADMVGKSCRSIMHKVTPTAVDLAEEIDGMILSQDEPFVSTSMYAQYRVFRLIQQNKVKVVLDGQGADEMLAGYRPYIGVRIAGLIRKGKFLEAQKMWSSVAGQSGFADLKYLIGQHLIPGRFQFAARKLVGKDLAPPWINAKWFEDQGVEFEPHANGSGRGSLQKNLIASMNGSLRTLLRYEDRNSMAHSIESRVPFLTPQLAQFVVSLPESYLISANGTSKSVFRKAMRGIVPDPVLDRTDKIAFVTPEQPWLQALTPWVETNLNSEVGRSLPAFNHEKLMEEWRQMSSGSVRYNMWTWRWINLIRWVGLNDVQFS